MDETRALLDALMGPNRNVKSDNDKAGTDFTDKTICKRFLVGFCPHDWFTLAKRQLNPCYKVHSEMMKAQFERHPDSSKFAIEYEEDFLRYLEKAASECDDFIRREKPKCRPKGSKVLRLPSDMQTRLDDKEKQYAELIKKSQEMAEESSLSISQAHMVEANALKEDIDGIKERYTFEFPGEDICDICGVRYPCGSGWEGHDKESHKRGKTHDGFDKIRQKIEELRVKKKDWEKLREKHKDWFRSQRKAREKEADEERELEKTKKKERERAEKEKEKERELEKEREEKRQRERTERDKERAKEREKEREKEKEKARAKDKDKDRDRDRDRAKDRSRSRDKKKDKESSKRKDKDDGGDKKVEAPPPPPPAAATVGEGAELAEKDLPAFWAQLGQLSAEGRQEALKGLNPRSTQRLEAWLVARIAARPS